MFTGRRAALDTDVSSQVGSPQFLILTEGRDRVGREEGRGATQ